MIRMIQYKLFTLIGFKLLSFVTAYERSILFRQIVLKSFQNSPGLGEFFSNDIRMAVTAYLYVAFERIRGGDKSLVEIVDVSGYTVADQ